MLRPIASCIVETRITSNFYNYSSCSPGHLPLRHNCLWFMIGRVTWEKPFIEWNLFLLCWIATNAFHTQSCKFPRLRTKEWGTIEFEAIALLTLYRSPSKDTPVHRTLFSHNVVWRVCEDQLRMAPHMHQTLSVPWCKRWCKYNPINESKPKNCLEHLKTNRCSKSNSKFLRFVVTVKLVEPSWNLFREILQGLLTAFQVIFVVWPEQKYGCCMLREPLYFCQFEIMSCFFLRDQRRLDSFTSKQSAPKRRESQHRKATKQSSKIIQA